MSRVRVYLTFLLRALQKIQKKRSGATQRQRSIRFAADLCLARTANKRSAWTRALNLRLMRKEKTMTTMKRKKISARRSRSRTLAMKMRLGSLGSLSSRCFHNVDLQRGRHDHDYLPIDKRLGALQKLVPGGTKMGVDTLFQETADYILNLQMQVHAMEALADFYSTTSAGHVDEFVVQEQHPSASLAAQI